MPLKEFKNYTRRYYILLALGALLYAGVTLLAPITPGAKTYNLNDFERHLVQLSVILPVIAIWVTAMYGAVRFKEYALRIRASKDGRSMNQIANGLLVLVLSLVLPSILAAFRPIIIDLGWTADWIVFRNYLTLTLVLVAFYHIYNGSKFLLSVLDKKPRNISQKERGAYLATAVLLVGYVALIFNNPYRNSTTEPATITSFYLPDAAILITLVFPYVLIWFWGIMSALYIQIYAKYTEGIIYRKSLVRLAQGLVAIIGFSISLQFLAAVGPILKDASLNAILVFVYVILILYAAGYVLIARGARRLARIEEVTG